MLKCRVSNSSEPDKIKKANLVKRCNIFHRDEKRKIPKASLNVNYVQKACLERGLVVVFHYCGLFGQKDAAVADKAPLSKGKIL